MFVDYYAILEVDANATQEEIKSAFKRQALKWHPDKNPGKDTTLRMQQINEAYLILKDPEAREHYNNEYRRFKQYQQQKEKEYWERKSQQAYEQQKREEEKKKYERQYEYTDYSIYDDVLKKWMENAKRQAVDLAKKTIEDFKGISTAGAKAVANETVSGIGRYLIFSVIGIIIFALIKTCNNQSKISTSSIAKPPTINPVEIPNDTFAKAKQYAKFVIDSVGDIFIPITMELQSKNYRKISEKARDKLYAQFHYEVSDNRIVFQQKGLNNLDKKGFGSYARVIIETTVGKIGEYQKLTDTISLTKEEFNELNIELKKQIEQSFNGTGLKLIKWNNAELVSVNGKPAIKISYLRQLDDKPFVEVQGYSFQNNDRIHIVTLSYRQQDSSTWKPLYPKIIKSFKITTVK